MATGITSVTFDDLGPTNPAQSDRITGAVTLNSRLISKYPPIFWEFILGHEKGHIVGNNRSEEVADAFASSQFFAAHPDKPFTTVAALKDVLPMNTPDQINRVNLQMERAARFDCANNGNKSSCALVDRNKSNMTGLSEFKYFEALKPRIATNPPYSIGIDNVTIIEMLKPRIATNPPLTTGGNFITQEIVFGNGGGGNISGYCDVDCLEQRNKDSKDKKTAADLLAAQTQANALQHQADLDFQKSILTLNALTESDQSKQTLAQLQYDLELKKLDASKAQPLDNKKIALVGLVAAAALLAIFLLNDSAQ